MCGRITEHLSRRCTPEVQPQTTLVLGPEPSRALRLAFLHSDSDPVGNAEPALFCVIAAASVAGKHCRDLVLRLAAADHTAATPLTARPTHLRRVPPPPCTAHLRQPGILLLSYSSSSELNYSCCPLSSAYNQVRFPLLPDIELARPDTELALLSCSAAKEFVKSTQR